MTRMWGGVAVLVLAAGASPAQNQVPPGAPAEPPSPAALALVHPFPSPAPPVVDPRTRAWEQVRTHVEARPHALPSPQGGLLPCAGKETCGASPALLERIRNLPGRPRRLLFSRNPRTGEWEMRPAADPR